jgi:hypothetical protein
MQTHAIPIAHQRQIALVRIQRMGARMRRDDREVSQIGDAQRIAVGEIEIREAVVYEVDGPAACAQSFAMNLEVIGIHDLRPDPARRKELPRQQELRMEKLLPRSSIDDRNGTQRRIAARQPPFVQEHLENPRLERRPFRKGREVAVRSAAAGDTRRARRDVEEGTAGIGVDLDELRTFGRQVEVETQENSARELRRVRNGRRPVEHGALVLGKVDDGFHRLHHLLHLKNLRRIQEHRCVGEQLRAHFLAERLVQLTMQLRQVDDAAVAVAVESVGESHAHVTRVPVARPAFFVIRLEGFAVGAHSALHPDSLAAQQVSVR